MYVIWLEICITDVFISLVLKKKCSKRFQPEPVSESIEGAFFLVYLHWTLSCRTFI